MLILPTVIPGRYVNPGADGAAAPVRRERDQRLAGRRAERGWGLARRLDVSSPPASPPGIGLVSLGTCGTGSSRCSSSPQVSRPNGERRR